VSEDKRRPSWLRAVLSERAPRSSSPQAGVAAAVSYSLIGAILLLGGLGYGVDRWLGTAPSGLVAGLLLGVFVGLYLLAKELWQR
jgi:ATP synthase protein I